MTKPMFARPDFAKWVLDRIPMGCLGQLNKVAAAVGFVASDVASLMTGTSLVIDRGVDRAVSTPAISRKRRATRGPEPKAASVARAPRLQSIFVASLCLPGLDASASMLIQLLCKRIDRTEPITLH